jgi:tetratricopeptide (TPR) repeat protein
VRLRPDDEVLLANYVVSVSDAGQPDRALVILDERLPRFPNSLGLRAWRADLLDRTGDKAGSREVYEQLFRDGYADEDALMTLIQMQLAEEDVDAALASVGEFLGRRSSSDVERWKGQLLSEKGEHEAAIELFRARRARRPTDGQAAYDLAEAHESAEQYAEALDICDEFADAKVDADLWRLLRGRCQLGLKWYREARQSFQAVLDKDPQNEEARELASYAAGLMGQGSVAGATTPIEAAPIPAELQARIDALPALTEASGEFGLAERYRLTGYRYVPDQEWKCTCYRSFKVFGPEGVDQLSSLSVAFDPLTERVFVNKLAVKDADGNLVAEGDVGDYYVTGDDDSELATSDQTLNVPVPQLKPGCTLEFVYTRERLGAPEEFGFESVVLGSGNPVQYAAAFVVGATDKIAAETAGGVGEDESSELLSWSIADPAPYVWEPDQTCLNDFLPFVHLGDRGATWEALGRDHFDEIKERLEVDPQVAERARELVSDATTTEEKVERLAQFVQKELTYQGLEFGIRGQMPHPAGRTLKAGYGDCKDHSVLLKQMLNSVGVPAEIALVLSAGRVIEALPSIDQFDHMVVYLPEAPPERAFVDCTSKYADPASTLFPDCEGGKALILDPERPRLIPTPAGSAEGSLLDCQREVEVVHDAERPETADAIVTETVTCDPLLAPVLRGALASYPPQERKTLIADLLREHSRVALEDLAIDGLTTPRDPLVLRMKYRVARAFHRGPSGALTGAIPSPWEQWWIDVDAVDNRRTPFEHKNARLSSSIKLKAPAGYRVVAPAAAAGKRLEDRYLTWELADDAAERRLTARQAGGVFAAGEYEQFYDQSQMLLDRLKLPIAIEPAP